MVTGKPRRSQHPHPHLPCDSEVLPALQPELGLQCRHSWAPVPDQPPAGRAASHSTHELNPLVQSICLPCLLLLGMPGSFKSPAGDSKVQLALTLAPNFSFLTRKRRGTTYNPNLFHEYLLGIFSHISQEKPRNPAPHIPYFMPSLCLVAEPSPKPNCSATNNSFHA